MCVYAVYWGGGGLSTLEGYFEYTGDAQCIGGCHDCLWGLSKAHWGIYLIEYIVQNNVLWFSPIY